MNIVDSSSSSDEVQLTINASYASNYDSWRSKEEYEKCSYYRYRFASSRVALGNRTRYDCELSDVYNEAYH